MTQEDKQLLLKDLSARLPYGVKVAAPNDYEYDGRVINGISKGGLIYLNPFSYKLDQIRPYLFPISSMTKKQKKEYYNICRNDWIDNKAKDIGEIEVLSKGIDYLNAHHFDYRGLIDKGLAIDATNLNIY